MSAFFLTFSYVSVIMAMRMLTSSTCEQKAHVHSTQVPMAEPAALTSESSPNSPYMAHHGRKKAPDGVHAPPPSEGIRPGYG